MRLYIVIVGNRILNIKYHVLFFRRHLYTTRKCLSPYVFYCLFIYSHVHTLFGPTLPSATPPPSLPDRTCSALFSNFVEEKT
jgi:hypothetical protein